MLAKGYQAVLNGCGWHPGECDKIGVSLYTEEVGTTTMCVIGWLNRPKYMTLGLIKLMVKLL